ncbi:alpha-L-arabinofuranosidase [Oscillochloris sp. ZM17-4]|uniref:alpha-L-arabinofuranosidase n=1 Tax=Oscillochloris sp. ZM17-4 TaxID=2866714 RepID=UPI001C73DAFC|nr:alpha-L-arabinofuranosidase [Oscillochloris sp. ZM17-4]MBX0328818.1 alpha-L-arabinofuranosidase [Oscillochloris sp. ZM17-4]
MRRTFVMLMLVAGMVATAACSRSAPIRPAPAADASPLPTSSLVQVPIDDAPAPTDDVPVSTPLPSSPDGRPLITVHVDGDTRPLDDRLFGTNIPAWLGPSNLGSRDVRTLTTALGASVLRLPGGSWSNAYSWLACETGDSDGCYWTWAARPTDFLNFVRATGQQAMWTVSINGTSKEAAALVAFFNGSVDDTTVIGVDVRGKDWKTVGDWAKLRAENGNPEPLPIKLWEVGNEVYGGKPDGGGPECADWGWEDVWTCDGKEYMLGKGAGAERHEGYLEFRAAMRAVDPTIMVGAVGVPHPSDWSNWGNEVIVEGGANLDFYVVHYYAFDRQPESAESILVTPQQIWAGIMDSTNAAFDALAGGRRAPVAVTEYNLVAFQEIDNEQIMTRAANALFVADMVGQMAVHGVTLANQWDLANGKAGNGTDYGLINVDTKERSPQYYALVLWSRFANTLLLVDSPLSDTTTLSLYAGRADDGTLSIMAINKTGEPLDAQLRLDGASGTFSVSADTFAAQSLDSTDITFNGVADPAIDLSDAPAAKVGDVDEALDYVFAPYSITLLHLVPTP